MTITEMRVHMDCVGCESKIKKALQKLDGVDDIDIDIAKQKVTVMGWAEQKKVLKAVKKTGRRVELWTYDPYNPQYNHNLEYSNYNHNYQTTQPTTYYYANCQPQHGYNSNYNHQQQQEYGNYCSSGVNVQATSLFSDENPHACSIM
ncbi:Heavy metal-associated isoprenylated plant protein 28 [Euphorbia peplus]|nr:Heavy metal-associated isoprenylated plant protein 28 [Euphorbia peplus]